MTPITLEGVGLALMRECQRQERTIIGPWVRSPSGIQRRWVLWTPSASCLGWARRPAATASGVCPHDVYGFTAHFRRNDDDGATEEDGRSITGLPTIEVAMRVADQLIPKSVLVWPDGLPWDDAWWCARPVPQEQL